ncbi:unnamed protein product [Rotaria socialis]|uniref:G-protein coupled receptors family 1 profile domain-containing protein n=1 Tax=Rotaria socialis TaxID=392032 RepID=A0A821BGF3_9BILA|nr:unnamed protein product [Rotaria socialis]CAF4594651.1 unnamed protein product [Rotaria socialis]
MLTNVVFTLIFSFSIAASIVGLLFCSIIFFVIISYHPCHTATNLLLLNTCVAIIIFYISTIIGSVLGFDEDWALNQPAGIFNAYCFLASCSLICCSYMLQAINRLCCTVFFKHKHLVTIQVTWYLIALYWIMGLLFAIEPLFFKNGFIYERESRLCVRNAKVVSISIFSTFVGFGIPLNLSILIYATIWYRVLQSSRRVGSVIAENANYNMPKARCQMKLVRNMIIVIGSFAGGDSLALVLVLWHAIKINRPLPEPLYLISKPDITVCVILMIITLFFMNTQVKNAAFVYLKCNIRHIYPVTITMKGIASC